MTKQPKIDIVCHTCGSNKVIIDAYAEWFVESQDWELCSTYDEAYCTICNRSTRLDELILE